MSWMIEFIGAIIITSVTGGLITLMWAWIGKKLDEKGFVDILYYLLWVNAFFYLFPLAYGVWWYGSVTGHPTHNGCVFFPTPFIAELAFVLTAIWAVGSALFFLIYLVNESLSWWRYSNGIAPEDWEKEVLGEACRQTGVRENRIRLYHSYHAKDVFLKGMLFPRIVLTTDELDSERLRCVFVHELNHYIQKDLALKLVCALIFCIHWYNPFVWWYRRLVYRWCEYACDNRSIKQVDDTKMYADTLAFMAKSGSFGYGLVSAWCEKEGELTKRVERIVRYYKMKPSSKRLALLLCTAIALCSTISVYAAADGLGRAYILLYDQTEVAIREETVPPIIPEYDEVIEEAGEWDEEAIITGKITNKIKNGSSFYWIVETGKTVATPSFYLESGTSVRILVGVTPGTVSVDAGLILPNNALHYVTGSSNVDHTFSIYSDGYYRVFVRNQSSTDVEVMGGFTIIEEE